MINTNPDDAKKWWSILWEMGKTKFGVGVIVFVVCALISVGIIYFSFLDTIRDLREKVKEKNKIIEGFPDRIQAIRDSEEKKCIETNREYFQLYTEQQEAIEKAKRNEAELEEMRRMMRELLYK